MNGMNRILFSSFLLIFSFLLIPQHLVGQTTTAPPGLLPAGTPADVDAPADAPVDSEDVEDTENAEGPAGPSADTTPDAPSDTTGVPEQIPEVPAETPSIAPAVAPADTSGASAAPPETPGGPPSGAPADLPVDTTGAPGVSPEIPSEAPAEPEIPVDTTPEAPALPDDVPVDTSADTPQPAIVPPGGDDPGSDSTRRQEADPDWPAEWRNRFDYEPFPRQDANYLHLRLDLQVDSLQIRGDAEYELMMYRDGVSSLSLDAIRLDIEQVEWNGRAAAYRVDDDKLVIELPEPAGRGSRHTLRIRYSANPAFGLLRRGDLIWSSGKPRSVRHWLPVEDHPRNSFTTDVSLIFPSRLTGVFSGTAGEEIAESVELKRVRFHNSHEIPASALRFAIGNFTVDNYTSGRYRIYLYSEEGLLSEQQSLQLMRDSVTWLRAAENVLAGSHPSGTISFVILEDDMWEWKNYGAGVVFGYLSLGDLSTQIASGITSQWLGVQIREEQWQHSEAVMLLHTWLHHYSRQIPERSSAGENRLNPQIWHDGVYSHWSARSRRSWEEWWRQSGSAEWQNLIREISTEMIRELPPVLTWQDFARYIYSRFGLNLFDPPQPALFAPGDSRREARQTEVAGNQSGSTLADGISLQGSADEAAPHIYRVNYQHNESSGQLRLRFEAVGEPVRELITIHVEEVLPTMRRGQEITITGERDEIVLNTGREMRNLKLQVVDRPDVKLLAEKPFLFWIHQLQTDDRPADRAEAAVGLRQFADNPDLQLALLDVLGSEEEPVVAAEVIRTLAAVTDGATGTDQIFRQRLRPDTDPLLQQALVEALANYPENGTVIRQLQQIATGPYSRQVREQAILSLAVVTPPDQFRELAADFLSDNRTEDLAWLILRQLAASGSVEMAVSSADHYLEPDKTYRNRLEIVNLLLEFDSSAERWLERIGRLSGDPDPRIRYRVLDGLWYLPEEVRQRIIGERLGEEYDERVARRLWSF